MKRSLSGRPGIRSQFGTTSTGRRSPQEAAVDSARVHLEFPANWSEMTDEEKDAWADQAATAVESLASPGSSQQA